jgi:hypothetical protein
LFGQWSLVWLSQQSCIDSGLKKATAEGHEAQNLVLDFITSFQVTDKVVNPTVSHPIQTSVKPNSFFVETNFSSVLRAKRS